MDIANSEGGWQTIETAPKDGSLIVGYDPMWYRDRLFMMIWDSRRDAWAMDSLSGSRMHPTHWMRMSRPPSL